MREHRYSLEMPHSAARLWALFQDYDRWTDYAPMVLRVDVVWPGDDAGNGLLRRVIYKLPLGRQGSALELVSGIEPDAGPDKGHGYEFTMLSRKPGDDQTGRVTLEPIGPNRTRFSFEERYNLTSIPWKWFEGPIYGFINRQNEESMRRASAWLAEHPGYRPDLIEPEAASEPGGSRSGDPGPDGAAGPP